ncbi:hypothetical protein Prudu_016307 [Prunus dulcis]|uniref:Uncharacterized protein n=1 Tax=Prunus dulcis TaxID=3755 RepID=A0A4Y1RL93_PRUDU|nr:hypothetical protein Prudu_016307 [Prunus dulcis]
MVSLLPFGFVGFVFSSLCIMPQDVSKVRVGKLFPYGIDTLRNINDFLGVKFVIMPCASTSTVLLKCVGCGLRKLSRKISNEETTASLHELIEKWSHTLATRIVVGNVGSIGLAGNGGSVTFGVVGNVGNAGFGKEGTWELGSGCRGGLVGSVGNVALGSVGTEGNGGNAALGSVGNEGNGDNVGNVGLGRDGIVGTVNDGGGAAGCPKGGELLGSHGCSLRVTAPWPKTKMKKGWESHD